MTTDAKSVVTALLDAADKGGISANIMARMLGVTRQMIYLYGKGTLPDEDKLNLMRTLTERILAAVEAKELPRPKRNLESEVRAVLDVPEDEAKEE